MKYTLLAALICCVALSGCANSGYNKALTQAMQDTGNGGVLGELDGTLVFEDPVLQRFYGQYKADFPRLGGVDWNVAPPPYTGECPAEALRQVAEQLGPIKDELSYPAFIGHFNKWMLSYPALAE